MGNAESKGALDISNPRPLSAINLHPDSPSSSNAAKRQSRRRSISDFSILSASASVLSLRKRPSQQQLSLDFAPSRPSNPSPEVRQRASLTSLRRSSGVFEPAESASSDARRTRSEDTPGPSTSFSRQEEASSSSTAAAGSRRRPQDRRRHSLAIDFGASARTDISPYSPPATLILPSSTDRRVASTSRNAIPSSSSRNENLRQTHSFTDLPATHAEPEPVRSSRGTRTSAPSSRSDGPARLTRRRVQSCTRASDAPVEPLRLPAHRQESSQRSDRNPPCDVQASRRSTETVPSRPAEPSRPSGTRSSRRRVQSQASVPSADSSVEPLRLRVGRLDTAIPVVDSPSDLHPPPSRDVRRVSSATELPTRRAEEDIIFDVSPVALAPPPPYSLVDPHSNGTTPPPTLPTNDKDRLSVPRRSERPSRHLRVVSTGDLEIASPDTPSSDRDSQPRTPSPSSTTISLSPASTTFSPSPSPTPSPTPSRTTSPRVSASVQNGRLSTTLAGSNHGIPSEHATRGRGRGYRPGTRHTHMAIVYPRTTSISTTDLPVDNPLQLLRRYKTVFVVDDSNSMKRRNRWSETRDALASLAVSAASYGLEGIDVHFLNSSKFGTDLRDEAAVKQLFDSVSPRGITMIAAKLENILHDYMTRLENARSEVLTRVKPVNYIIITDGTSTDDPVPVIIQAARRLDEGSFPVTQVGLQFIQIGSDPRATEALRRLDDDVHRSSGVRDIVDITPYAPGHRFSSDTVIKALLSGINRRVNQDGNKAAP